VKRIFWGLFFIFFNLNLNLGSSTISFLPDFVGYALIWSGMKQVDCGAYITGRPWACVGTIYSAVIWVLNCAGIGNALSATVLFAVLFAVAGTVIKLGVLYWITRGVCELEQAVGRSLYGQQLRTAWVVLLVCMVAAQATALLSLAVIAVVVLVASVIAMIYYIVRFHISRKEYGQGITSPEERYEPSDHV